MNFVVIRYETNGKPPAIVSGIIGDHDVAVGKCEELWRAECARRNRRPKPGTVDEFDRAWFVKGKGTIIAHPAGTVGNYDINYIVSEIP